MIYIYSSAVGCFVFNQAMQLREKVIYTHEQAVEYSKMMASGKRTPPEEEFHAKFKNSVDLKDMSDPQKLLMALEHVGQFKESLRELGFMIVRENIRDSVTEDVLLVQSVNAIDELTKASNLLVKRLRECYSFYFPELGESIEDNEAFVASVLSKDKKQFAKELSVRVSMGPDLPKEDVEAILSLARRVKSMYDEKAELEAYLETMMKRIAPNIRAVAGTMIGAKLISIAGTMRKLVLFPASTIQLLGAEKALFRHLVNRKILPPKYGILHEHRLITKTPKKNHGKVARALADKISIAAKIDFFKGQYRGDQLLKELEERVQVINAK